MPRIIVVYVPAINLNIFDFEILNRAKMQPKIEPIKMAKKAIFKVVSRPCRTNIHLLFEIMIL